MKEKNIFVTVGTTRFEELIRNTISNSAIEWMISQGFTSLTVQYGTGTAPTICCTSPTFHVQKYDFKPSLEDDMKKADLIISHAGAGSIMEALRLSKKLVVVINTRLMNNHQEELAGAMAQRGHLYMVKNPELLESTEIWAAVSNFCPMPYEGGDDQDFPRILDSYLGFGCSKVD